MSQLDRTEISGAVPSGSQWSRPAPAGSAPSARCGHTTTKAGTKLYLFGGWSGTKMHNDLYILDPETMRWTRPTASGKPPRARAGHTCTAIGPSASSSSSTSANITTNIASNITTSVTSNITPNINTTLNIPPIKDHNSPFSKQEQSDFLSVSNEINASNPLHSSSSSKSCPVNAVPTSITTSTSTCDPIQSSNSSADDESSNNQATLPSSVTNSSIAGHQINPTNQNIQPNASQNIQQLGSQRLLIFGGGDNETLFNDLHLIEVDSLQWSPVFTAGSSPSPRSRHSATLVKTTLWVIGGLGEAQMVFNDVYTLNTTSMVWSKPHTKGTPMSPRWGHSAIRNGSFLIIFGGHDGRSALNDIHILDTESLTWKSIETPKENLNQSITLPTPTSLVSSSAENLVSKSQVSSLSQPQNPAVAQLVKPDAESNESSQKTSQELGNSEPTIVPNNNSSPPLPCFVPAARTGHSANFVLMGRERKMVIFGGGDGGSIVFNDTCVLDLDSWTWVSPQIKGSLPFARSVHTANMVDDKLFVIGGIDTTRRFKDIYTLGLTNLVHVEDVSMGGILRRPRRSSRASPRIGTSSSNPQSPRTPTHPSSNSTGSPNSAITPLVKKCDTSGVISPVPANVFANNSLHQNMYHEQMVQTENMLTASGNISNDSSPSPPFSLHSSLKDGSAQMLETLKEDEELLEEKQSRGSVPGSRERLLQSVPRKDYNIASWLSSIGMQKYLPNFEKEEIDMDILPYLTEDHLQFLGVNTLGARIRIYSAIQVLKGPISPRNPSPSHRPSQIANQIRDHLEHVTQTQQHFATLESSVENLVSTVLVATKTLTDTMNVIASKLNPKASLEPPQRQMLN